MIVPRRCQLGCRDMIRNRETPLPSRHHPLGIDQNPLPSMKSHCRTQRRAPTTQLVVDDQSEWQRSYFDLVVGRMTPERDSMSRSPVVYFRTSPSIRKRLKEKPIMFCCVSWLTSDGFLYDITFHSLLLILLYKCACHVVDSLNAG